jgi:hypothetical protein
MTTSQLFLQRRSGFTRALAGPSVRPGALAAHGQATTMTETAVAADVHQAFDVHRGFTTQIAFNSELSDVIPDFFQVTVGQVFDFFGVINLTSFANFASACASDTKNGGQANLGMLLRRNIDASDTCHFRPLKLLQLTLALLMARVGTDHTHNTLAADDFAVAANLLDRS